jgi:hypothetical protein
MLRDCDWQLLLCNPVRDLSFRAGRKILEANASFLLRRTQPHNSPRTLNRLPGPFQLKTNGHLHLSIQFGRCMQGQSTGAQADDDAAIPWTQLDIHNRGESVPDVMPALVEDGGIPQSSHPVHSSG